MFEGKSVAVVVPCYNEVDQISKVLETMPDFVDSIIVVDDASRDGTAEIVRGAIEARRQGDLPAGQQRTGEIELLTHEVNRGVGAAIVTGYKLAVRRQIDITAVMAGDGQMDPKQLRLLLMPLADGEADYTKANRLFYRRAWDVIPRSRYLGNAFLSMLTKIASGYWHVADSQTGYTAISLEALETIDLDALYPRYGYPNDLLVRLNVDGFRVADVPLRPIYSVGEKSKMRVWKVIPRMSWLILKRFHWRMWQKYVIRDFHPLVLFYAAGTTTGLLSLLFFIRLVYRWIASGAIPQVNALVWALCLISSTQFALFGMWFDMEMNRDLNPFASRYRSAKRSGGAGTPTRAPTEEPTVSERK